jgi:hypothetical protein
MDATQAYKCPIFGGIYLDFIDKVFQLIYHSENYHIKENRMSSAKQVIQSIVLGILLPSMFALSIIPDICYANETIKIPSGTEIPVVIAQTLSSETCGVGTEIIARVSNDLIINGSVVIRKGEMAVGIVEVCQKNGAVGSAGKLTIALTSTRAVDGSQIALTGTKSAEGESKVGTAVIVTILCCILGLLMKGSNAQIVSGTQIICRTAQDASITIN